MSNVNFKLYQGCKGCSTYECPKLATVDMIMNCNQVLGIKLKCLQQHHIRSTAKISAETADLRELGQQLPGGVDELREHGRDLAAVPREEAAAVRELVSEVEPVLLYERLEALDGSVVGVDQQLGEGAGLAGAVPAVRAVHHHAHSARHTLLRQHVYNDRVRAILPYLRDEQRSFQDSFDVFQPLTLVYSLKELFHRVYFQLTSLYEFAAISKVQCTTILSAAVSITSETLS